MLKMLHCISAKCRAPLRFLRACGFSKKPPKWDTFAGSDVACKFLAVFFILKVREDQVPKQADVLVVGGGVVGWSVAFWLRWFSKFSVTVVERDPTYAHSASVLGLGSIRQQFSEPENIQMSLFASEFLRNVNDYLAVLGMFTTELFIIF